MTTARRGSSATADPPSPEPSSKRFGKIGIVSARYGASVVGGAETVLRELALGLRRRGFDIEVLTSNATDLYTYRPDLAEGVSDEDGIPVHRFRAVPAQRGADPIGHNILSGNYVSVADQLVWMNTGPRCPGVFQHLVDHAEEYEALICAPYQAWTSFVSAEIAPQQTVTIPCLHDEPFARLEIFRGELETTSAVWFLSEPEMSLAQRLFDLPNRARVIGSGITPPAAYDADGFRRRHGIEEPFLLYAGRREAMKGWTDLLDCVSFANDTLQRSIPLVTCGVGSVGSVPANVDVRDLGFLSDQERSDAFAAAAAYVQPSAMESFSRTVLEAWLAGTPVIANAHSDVVSWHAERSGAGLLYRDRYEFAEALRLLHEQPSAVHAIASAGREYVLNECSWDRVLDTVTAALAERV
ncbi:MAG: glycosyltransferase family 4 protein [Candidatus Dormibacteraeota bacterium]|nr:glycosyltransferase family 4 protein [Candidatus Dormibacteraeota bacterium]MBV9524900.1 glycosyltransferase family 4 protein [Candidatus Dormibacteraeota bacterium]